MRCLVPLATAALIASAPSLAQAESDIREGVPELDHVYLVVLENHNASQIIGNPNAPHLSALAARYNYASNYNAVWHPSLPNYVAMITGDWIGTDVLGNTDAAPPLGTGKSYLPNSLVGIGDDDSPSVALDFAHANPSRHRWRVNLPSIAGELTNVGKDWRAYLQNIPETGSYFANWPGDSNTAKLYAVKHNPFPYVGEVQDNAFQFVKQVTFDQLFSDLGGNRSPAFSFIVPDQCRDMHGIGNPLAPCGTDSLGGDNDANDVRRGDDEAYWLTNAILGSAAWKSGRNALFITFDEGNGPLTCPGYSPYAPADTAPGTLKPGAGCYAAASFNDPVVMIVITNYGTRGVVDSRLYTHYSLLKTIEAAFGLPYLGHAADATTHTLAPLLRPAD